MMPIKFFEVITVNLSLGRIELLKSLLDGIIAPSK
jgi:hypothetical protein